MSGRAAEWPVAIVTGLLGAGKTTMISRLLRHPAMADTLVLVNEFGEVGLDHELIRAVSDNVVLLPNGCLCCTIRQDIVQTLRDLRRGWLAGSLPDFGRVLIETTGLAEPAPLVASIAAHPLLADHFILQTISTVVDGQYGVDQLVRSPTGRNQVAMADHLMISKGDLTGAEAAAELREQLTRFNSLATIGSSSTAQPDLLFGRTLIVPRSLAFCDDPTDDHLADIATFVLRPASRLCWPDFRIWLGQLLEESGSQLLRLKGRLLFDDLPSPMIIQAVRHTFYPVVAAPAATEQESWLVLIFEGSVPDKTAQRIDTFGLRL